MTLPAYRRAVEEAFARAAGAKGVVLRSVRCAGAAIEIRFAGEALVRLLFPSLGHLEAEPHAAPDLTVCVWDAASTGATIPRVAPSPPKDGTRVLSREGPFRLLAEHETLSLVDLAAGRAFCAYPSAADVPPWDVAGPFRFLFSSWFAARGVQIVHAGAVGARGRAVLLTAPGGSGKSATALQCLASGLAYLGDDFVLAGAPPDPLVFSLYSVAKLDPGFLASRFAGVPGNVVGREPQREGKVLLDVASRPGAQLPREAALHAVLVPRITGVTRLRPIRPMEALRAMAPTTALCLPGAGPFALERMSALVRSVPCFSLELGDDPAEIAGAVRDLVEAPAHAH